MKLYLRIREGGSFQLMKMDAGSDISLNFSHDNLENPSNYVSEYSYNLKVPICPENNKLFTNFVHLDSLVVSGGYDPTKTMEYVILDNSGSLISTGIAYIKTISDGYYNLSLTGSLSRIFQRLLNSGWNTENQDLDYYHMTDLLKMVKAVFPQMPNRTRLIPGTNVINKDVVYASWMIDNPVFDLMQAMTYRLRFIYGVETDETKAFIASIIGFAPTAQGLLPGFSNDRWIEIGTINGGQAQSFASLPVLCSERDANNEPINPIDVGDGLIEAQMGEYRSYYQQPYIYIDKLWQIYQMEFANITDGYSLILDPRWFAEDNPRLKNLVYMLPRLWDENNSAILDSTTLNAQSVIKTLPTPSGQRWESSTFLISGINTTSSTQWSEIHNTIGHKLTYDFELNLTIQTTQTAVHNGVTYTRYHSKYNFIEVLVSVSDLDNMYYGYPAIMGNVRYLIVPIPDDGRYTMDDIMEDSLASSMILGAMDQGYKIVECTYTPGNGNIDLTTFRGQLSVINTRSNLDADIEDVRTRLSATVSYISNNTPWMTYVSGTPYYIYGNPSGTPYTKLNLTLSDIKVNTTYATRTEKILSLENLFRDEKPFNILLKYSKMMHLVWQVDDRAKTVTVKTSRDFYHDLISAGGAGITDLTDYVDLSKGIIITPLSWTDNKVQFNFDTCDLDYIKEYEERYGNTYGSKTLITANKIQSTTKKLLCNNDKDTIKPSAMLSETIYPVGQIISQARASLGYVENVPMPLNQSGGESADHHGNFLFRIVNGQFDSRVCGGWRQDGSGNYAYITDDLDAESNLQEWAWHGTVALSSYHQSSWILVRSLPRFDTTSPDGSISIQFAAVRELFARDSREPSAYLYDDVWKDYIEEVYDVQNKTVTLYAHVTKAVFDTLKADPLVKIENILYMLTSVDGWGEHSEVCKLTLRQIFDLSKLAGTSEIIIEDGNYILCEDENELVTQDEEYLIQE